MIADLKPYPAYKDSGVEWLGQVPEAWEVRRLNKCVEINRRVLPESTPPDFEFGYLDISSVGTGRLAAQPARMRFSSAPSRARRVVSPGDTLVSTVRTYLKATWWAGSIDEPLVCSTGFAVLTPRAQNSGFWGYVAQSEPFTRAVVAESVGVAYPAIADERFRHLSTVLPPSEDQAAIIRFLDHVNSRIQRLLSARKRLIELLQEEKRLVIHEAVTNGLDASVRLKPSGIKWVGDVPEHWAVRRLKAICQMKAGETITVDSIHESDEVPVYGGNGLRGFTSDSTHKGDHILIGRQGALCGNVHLVSGHFWASEHAIVLDAHDQYDLHWIRLLLTAMNLNQYSQAAAQPGLSTDRIRNLWVPVPPPDEQRAIAEIVDQGVAKQEETEKLALRHIALLREYRTRLISDVVTGKLDVREAAARLPDDPDAEDPALGEQLEGVAAG